MSDDVNVLFFARKISMLSIKTPISKDYDRCYGQRKKCWWSSQREHLTVWCLHYPTGGTEGFRHKPSDSAKAMYNSFGRPETLLWLAEALGLGENVLQEVVGKIKGIKRPSSCCKVIREEIPFSKILELLEGTK